MASKKTVKIKDLAQRPHFVDVSDEEQISLRALTLREMVQLFIDSSDAFLPLYAAGLNPTVESLAPFLLSAPELVAKIIALASDEPDGGPDVERMPGTVQLIALSEVWKASVPDPKKAQELLSEVMALLQRLNESVTPSPELPKTDSPMISPPPSNS